MHRRLDVSREVDGGRPADLKDGESDLGQQYTPQVQEGYFSTVAAPTEVYRCTSVVACPGGTPGSCNGGLVDTPCATCNEGWRQISWVVAVVASLVLLPLLYYLASSKLTSKATVLFATTASVGMMVMSMQNLGLIGMMTVAWPEDLKGFFSVCQFLLLDIDSYGFSCLAGSSAAIRYLFSALMFPIGAAWLWLCYGMSRFLPTEHRWILPKTQSTCGAFLQVGFSTMSATALAPMMCYKHPNGLRSVLKYPEIICGSDEHSMILAIGWTFLIVFVLGFVALCTFAVTQVPRWSVEKKLDLVASVRFLVFRFRLDAWWFGVPLLVRGPLLSLPVVLATDYPPVQIIVIATILTAFLVMQMLFWPWKVPLLNLTDCTVSFCITLLVTTSSLSLKIVEGPMMVFAEGVSTIMLTGIFCAMGTMCAMTVSALIYRSALGGKQEMSIFNLGHGPSTRKVAAKMKALAKSLKEMELEDEGGLSTRLAALAVFDMNQVTSVITLLSTEVAPPAEDATTYKFNARINSASFDPALTKKKRPLPALQKAMETGMDADHQSETSDDVEALSEVVRSSWI
ncbi:Ephrin_rec_like domain-containing protein [Durusdinium trenchii]|uniref:Ephrin_rec_like domain-containing protein n=3 Tax=Durusdinium trenchii TaxID=1381693 RepID=A0ABP0PPC0_9DINO